MAGRNQRDQYESLLRHAIENFERGQRNAGGDVIIEEILQQNDEERKQQKLRIETLETQKENLQRRFDNQSDELVKARREIDRLTEDKKWLERQREQPYQPYHDDSREQLRREIDTLRREKQSLIDDGRRERNRQQQLQDELRRFRGEQDQLIQDKLRLEARVQDERREKDKLRRQLQEQNAENLQEELRRADKEIETLKRDCDFFEAKMHQEKRTKEDLQRRLTEQQFSEDKTLREELTKASRKILELTEESARLQANLQGNAHHEEEIQRLNLEVIELKKAKEVLNDRNEDHLTRIHQLVREKEGIAAQKKQVELQLHNTKLLSPQTAPVNDKRVSDLKAQMGQLHSQLQQQEFEMKALREENTELNRRCEEYAHNEQRLQAQQPAWNQLPPGSTHQHRFYQDNLDRMQRDYDNLKARYDKLDSEKEEVAKELAKTTRRSRGERETYDKERKEWQRRENELTLINHQRDSEIQDLKGQLSVLTRDVSKPAPKRVSFSGPDIDGRSKSGEAPVSILKKSKGDPVTEPIVSPTLEDIKKLQEEIQKMGVTVKEVEDDNLRRKTSLHEN